MAHKSTLAKFTTVFEINCTSTELNGTYPAGKTKDEIAEIRGHCVFNVPTQSYSSYRLRTYDGVHAYMVWYWEVRVNGCSVHRHECMPRLDHSHT